MADIIVDTYKLNQYAQRIQDVNSRITKLDNRLDSLYWRVGLQGLFDLMKADAMTGYSWRLLRCQSYLQQTSWDFETKENLILREDPLNFDGGSIKDVILANMKTASDMADRSGIKDRLEKLAVIAKPYAVASVLNMFSPVTGLLYITSGVYYGNIPSFKDSSRTPSASASADWLGYEFSEDNPGVTAWVGKASAEAKNEWGYAGVNAYLGKAEAEAKADFSFMEVTQEREYVDGKWVEKTETSFVNAELSAGASVSMLAADAEAGLGSDMLGVEVEAEGSAGNAKLEGKGVFSIDEDGVDANLKGEAMVSAAEGEVSGSINIFGLEIKGTVGGYAGALGVEGEVGIVDNKFKIEGGVAALVGFSAGVEVGFNDDGWDNFVDFVTFWD